MVNNVTMPQYTFNLSNSNEVEPAESFRYTERKVCIDNIDNINNLNITNILVNFYKFGNLFRLDL